MPRFSIVPNPAMDEITVVEAVNERDEFTIFDPLGRSYHVSQSGNSLDVSSLAAGVYYVTSGSSIAKFVKE